MYRNCKSFRQFWKSSHVGILLGETGHEQSLSGLFTQYGKDYIFDNCCKL